MKLFNKQETTGIVTKPTQNSQIHDTSLQMLGMEFQYAKETSLQAQQDRLTILNFYLGLYGAATTIILGIGVDKIVDPHNYFFLLFGLLGIISYLFVLQLVRLRQAWIESIKAMNRIKEYFMDNDKSLNEYILWKAHTIPKPHKFKTISYFSALLISILGAVSVACGAGILSASAAMMVAAALGSFVLFMGSYYLLLRYNG